MEKTRVSVEVAGQTIRLRAEEDEAYVQSIAAYVNEKIAEQQKANPSLSTSNCVVLSALNIVDELFKLRQQYTEMDRCIEELRRLTTEQNASAGWRGVKTPVKRPFEEKPVSVT